MADNSNNSNNNNDTGNNNSNDVSQLLVATSCLPKVGCFQGLPRHRSRLGAHPTVHAHEDVPHLLAQAVLSSSRAAVHHGDI